MAPKTHFLQQRVIRAAGRALIYAVLIVGGLTMILPFYWMITTSLKTPDEVVMMPPQWIPVSWKWDNYRIAWEAAPFGRYLLNSVIVTLLSTLGELITSILAAFAFARLRFYGRELLFFLLLATMMIPGEILLAPNFVTLTELGWIDRYEALIVPWTANAFAIFLFRQYFLGIPDELYAAARIDGSGDFRYLWRIMVPLSTPVIITSALIKVIGSWNAFLWPLIVTNSAEMRTLPVGLTAFVYDTGKNYELLMAASSMIILPMIALYLVMQKHVVEGIARTGIKG
ncbi:MAG: carbohydrate ABC transporter permease [Paenibacillus macerans]|uniref:carbohydrate ABC transporter permease n=1 Tax=Paenibacillus TaxID=44249 RepID=UPI000979F1DE|nr:carbohydrate ABC transporter permease [Paenibacillus macerans]MDU7476637.1 carbohydrate ABC transporter permease [Paenibacillus macerans]OMG48703.1 ABC transporter permease [Paenibacillus macerans]